MNTQPDEAKETSSEIAEVSNRRYDRVTVRAVLLSLLLMVVNDYWLIQLEVVRYSFATYAAPFYNCIFTLLVVTAANLLVRKVSPKFAFSRIELLTVYIMLSISSAVCSTNMMQILIPIIGHAFFFASPENEWEKLFLDKLPTWLTVNNQDALKNFYYGNSTLYDPANYLPWIVPTLYWSAFCTVLIFTMLCINTIFRKQWIESERLTFPIVMLPLEMTEESGSLFKNKYMWLGFAIAGFITLLAGLHYLYPSVPYIRIIRRDIGRFVVAPPWNAIGLTPMGFYFWAIGIAFLMPLDLSFSCWFFFWLYKLELVASTAFGWNQLKAAGGGFDSSFPYPTCQAYGAYLGFFVMSMWTCRNYLRRVFRTAFKGTKEEDESREAISYRSAILGIIAGILFLCGFSWKIGMTWWVIAVFFIFYFIFAIIVSRIRAELGFPTHDMHVIGPQHLIETTAGTKDLATQNLVGFSLFYWFNRTYASHPSSHQAESYKLSERTGTPARQIFYASMIAAAVALPIAFWMMFHILYKLGGATANMGGDWPVSFGNEAYSQLATWIKQPFPPNVMGMLFVGVGFIISMFLSLMRLRFLWFPFHPLAYAIANSWGVLQLWMPLFIGSTIKFIMLRFGGLSMYRKSLPFFYGLILGEIAIGSLWTILGVVLGIPTYDFWPGKYD